MQPAYLLTLLTLSLSTLAADTLTRDICHCAATSDYVGYARQFTYTNGRTGLTFTAQKSCFGLIASAPPCSEDIFVTPGYKTCSEGKRFCYNEEFIHKDKYSFDGQEASLKHAGHPESSGVDCNEVCGMLKEGMRASGKGTNEVFKEIEPGL
ncbi:MAG: hypothetical protein Q9186_002582 [Xanthomendoza sp. 1 TL-2023]